MTMTFWKLVLGFYLTIFFIVGTIYVFYPKDRPEIGRTMFMGSFSIIVILTTTAIITSGLFYQPKSDLESAGLGLLAAFGGSILAAALGVVVYRKVRPYRS